MYQPVSYSTPYRVLGLGNVPYIPEDFKPSPKNTPNDKLTLQKKFKEVLPKIYRYYPEEKTIPLKDKGYMGAYNLYAFGLNPFHCRIKFYNDKEREKFGVTYNDGIIKNAITKQPLCTLDKRETMFIMHQGQLFIMPTYGKVMKLLGLRPWHQHSSLARNQPIEMAGTIEVNEKGKVIFLANDSGHYQPPAEDFIKFMPKLYDTLDENCTVKIIISKNNEKTLKGKQQVKEFLASQKGMVFSNKT